VLHAVSKKDQHCFDCCFERSLNGSVARQVRGVTAMEVASSDNQSRELNCTIEYFMTNVVVKNIWHSMLRGFGTLLVGFRNSNIR
jgi:hypothetical protein